MEAVSALRDFMLAVQAVGPLGVIFFLWWQGHKESQRWKEHFEQEAHKWEDRFQTVKRMYENNVVLVKAYEKLANEQQDIVIMNTQSMTKAHKAIEDNRFCPRIKEKSKPSEVSG